MASQTAASPIYRTGIVYDERMALHKDPYARHVECPERIDETWKKLKSSGILAKCTHLESGLATDQNIELVHTAEYIEKVKRMRACDTGKVSSLPESCRTYTSDQLYDIACLSTGCLLNLLNAVMTGAVDNGFALIRPPGHHAEKHSACGFCYFNNIAIAAKYAQAQYNVSRVLVVDWDIHHGNGIQDIFYDDPSVMYISLHRHDHGTFFPRIPDGNYDRTGEDPGRGYNINIAFNDGAMGDDEYMAAFREVVLPVANQFKPELIFVASGFDAADGDPLGQYKVTESQYSRMTRMLMGIDSKLILVIEGGYNIEMIGKCVSSCVKTLLGTLDAPTHHGDQINQSARTTLDNVKGAVGSYWDL